MSTKQPPVDRQTLLALVEASQALIREPHLDHVLQCVVEQAAAVLHAEGASVLLLDQTREELVFRTATGPKGEQLVGDRFDSKLGIAGQAIRTGRPVRVDDVRQNRNFFEGVDAKTHMQTRAIIAAPLTCLDVTLGVIEVINPRERSTFTDGDINLLQLFTNLAAAALRNSQAFERVERNNLGLRHAVPKFKIIGESAQIKEAIDLCRRAAPSNATIMITGDTGTGKELFARAVHDYSGRRDNPFIAINCAALPETLLESELFGHEKGAFTGATQRKLGRFELADGGTLFLDELGEMTTTIQVKLLRVLQEREFVRVGGTTTVTCDVRVVAATNRDLKREVEADRFRSELYYRLNVFPIPLPPLRDRIDDLPLLIDHFVRQLAPSLGVEAPRIDDEVIGSMREYSWPGNIRELRNIIERCALLATNGRITLQHLPSEFAVTGSAAAPQDGESAPTSKLATQERTLILKALNDAGWNQSAAARHLGVSRDHLRYRIKKYGLVQPGSDG